MKFEHGKPKFKNDSDGAPTNDVEFIEPYAIDHPEYLGAFEKFEYSVAELAFRPWSIEMLADVKLSAMEIDILGPLLTDKPFLQAVEDKYN